MSAQFQVLPEEVTFAAITEGDLIASREGRFIGLVTDVRAYQEPSSPPPLSEPYAGLRRIEVVVRYWFIHDKWAEAVPGTTYALVGDDADTVNPVKVSEVP